MPKSFEEIDAEMKALQNQVLLVPFSREELQDLSNFLKEEKYKSIRSRIQFILGQPPPQPHSHPHFH
jgi:hypothetical protein